MIPIKNFKTKTPYLAKKASLIKNFKMPFIKVIANKKGKK